MTKKKVKKFNWRERNIIINALLGVSNEIHYSSKNKCLSTYIEENCQLAFNNFGKKKGNKEYYKKYLSKLVKKIKNSTSI